MCDRHTCRKEKDCVTHHVLPLPVEGSAGLDGAEECRGVREAQETRRVVCGLAVRAPDLILANYEPH